MNVASHFLANSRFELRRLKQLAERALDQLPEDDALHRSLDAESNSIAVLMQHLGGNLRSRWTDFLTTDGEKPDRHRDREFQSSRKRSRAELVEDWNRGWSRLFETLDALRDDDFEKTVRIRGEEHTVPEAIQRAVVHCAYHVGQIVLLAKHERGEQWNSLSIPKGGSEKAKGRYKP